MKFSLDTKIIKPENSNINNAVILLHGYGGDGIDISAIVLNWKRFLPETVFLCPNGHETCSINPNGFQWFDIGKDDSTSVYYVENCVDILGMPNKMADQRTPKFN